MEIDLNKAVAQEHRVCTKCVMDTTDPCITFDENGVCNHCYTFENKAQNWFTGAEGEQKFQEIVSVIKNYGRRKEYDCILGLSGGVDSSYVAILAKEAGLRPLVVHVDAGWNSELSVYNIEQLVKYCNFDLHTEVVNWGAMKNLQKAYLNSGIANQDVPQDHVFFSNLYYLARKNNIKYILSGSNIATEGIFPSSWHGDAMDSQNLLAIFKKFGTGNLKGYRTMSFFEYYIMYPFAYRMETIKPLNYINYNKANAAIELKEKVGYKPYKGKHGESVFTKFFQNYYLPKKHGFDKRLPHLSSLIASGQLDREEALKILKEERYQATELKKDIKFVAKKLGLSQEELEQKMIDPVYCNYEDFPNWNSKIAFLKMVNRKLKSFGVKLSLKAH